MFKKELDKNLATTQIGTGVLVFVGAFFLIISIMLTYFTFFSEPETQSNFSGRGAGGALGMGVICLFAAYKKKKTI